MNAKKLTMAGLAGGTALTALFISLNSGIDHEPVTLNAETQARINAKPPHPLHLPLELVVAPDSAASSPSGLATIQTAAASPRDFGQAKTYFQNFNLSQRQDQRFQTLMSVFRELGSNPANAHALGLTPEGLVAIIRSEARQMATSLSGAIGLKVDGQYPNTEDFYKTLELLETAERFMSLDIKGNAAPNAMWNQIIRADGTALSQDSFDEYQREIGIALAKDKLASYRMVEAMHPHEPSFIQTKLDYLEAIQKYGSRAWLGAGERDVWKEIGIPKNQLNRLVEGYKQRPEGETPDPPRP